MDSWRFTYTYSNKDLQEYLSEIRNNTFEFFSVPAMNYMLRREILLQSHERGLIRLPEGFIASEAHLIPVEEITFLEIQQTKT